MGASEAKVDVDTIKYSFDYILVHTSINIYLMSWRELFLI